MDNTQVQSVFAAYPKEVRVKLQDLRRLILETASRTEGVGDITETLKWGQPSYVTAQTKSGSTVRIDSHPQGYAVYFHCQTNLVETFRIAYGSDFEFEGNRAIVFGLAEKIPKKKLQHCISQALTYHLDKKRHSTN